MSSAESTQEVGSKRARYAAGAVLLVVVALVLVLATRPSAESTSKGSPLVGRPAPALAGTTLDGSFVDLATLRGRYVVVNFFATWCVPCREEHPELRQFVVRHPGAQAPTVVAVAYDQNDIASARSFFAQQGGDWPVVATNGSRIAVEFGVRGLPESYVVNPDGILSAHITGQVTADQLDRLTGVL